MRTSLRAPGRPLVLLLALSGALMGCHAGASAGPVPAVSGGAASAGTPSTGAANGETALATEPSATAGEDRPSADTRGIWVGAAAEGEVLATGTRDAALGVWIDVPEAALAEARPPLAVAIVVDTSGSMGGPKIEQARAAAAHFVANLRDGDMVALDEFSDRATAIVPMTRIDASSRREVLARIADLRPRGGTNMFDGLALAEAHAGSAPSSHGARRVIVISDGRANVGPQSPDILGAVAERGMRNRVQITSLGVGNDYDESTLNALAVSSSGRMYHISDPREMTAILREEVHLLDRIVASDAALEIVTAPGVSIVSVPTGAEQTAGGAARIPLGSLHAGQRREALVRVAIHDPRAFGESRARALASVRLRFRDSRDGDLERVHEVVARARLSSDAGEIARAANPRTQAILALADASRSQVRAAAQLSAGDFADADRELGRVEAELAAQARSVASAPERKRLEVAASKVAAARATARALPSKPKATQRDEALRMNADAMQAAGF